MSIDLTSEKLDINNITKQAINDEKILNQLLKNIKEKNDKIRFNSFEILKIISINHPEKLYDHWNVFSEMLTSKNNYHKYIAIHILSELTKIDTEKKFEEIIDKYFDIFKENKTMTAGHLALSAGKIIKNKPDLEEPITEILLNIEKNHKGKQIDLVKAYVIDAFSKYCPDSKYKKQILVFVKKELSNKSPKTKQKAKGFLEKYETL